MKKTIVVFLTLCGVAGAASVDFSRYETLDLTAGLVAAFDFTTGAESVGNLKVDTTFSVANGVATLGTGKNQPWHINALTIGTNTNMDWSISFDLTSLGENDAWDNILAIYSGTDKGSGYKTSMTFSMDDANQLRITSSNGGEDTFGGNSAVTLNTGIYDADKTDAGTTHADGQTITLVQDGAAKTLTLYINGEQTAQATNWTAAAIKSMQFGVGLTGRDPINDATIDNLAFWDKALSSKEVKSLIIPEPTTATLSLLALAGLATRRRRK